MAEMIARIRGRTGELNREVETLSRNIDGLVAKLDRMDPRFAQAVRSLEQYRQKVAAGGELNREELTNYRMLQEMVRREGVPQIRATMPEIARPFERWVGVPTGGQPYGDLSHQQLSRARRAAERDLGRTEKQILQTAPGDTPEHAQLREQLRANDPELQRLTARQRILQREVEQRAEASFPPAASEAPKPPPGESFANVFHDAFSRRPVEEGGRAEEGGPIPEPLPAGRRFARHDIDAALRFSGPAEETAPVEESGRAEETRRFETEAERTARSRRTIADETERSTERVIRAERRLTPEQRLAGMTAKELAREYDLVTRALRDQETELNRATQKQARLDERSKAGLLTKAEKELSLPGLPVGVTRETLPAYVEDLRTGLRAGKDEQERLRREAESRGMRVEGERLVSSRTSEPAFAGGGVKGAVGAFLGGAGFGGGSVTGSAAGVALGALPLSTGIAGIAGMFLGKGIQYGKQAYETHVGYMGQTLPLGIATRTDTAELLRGSIDQAERYRMSLPEVIQARNALAFGAGLGPTGSGRRALDAVLTTARITGLNPAAEAARTARLLRLSASLNEGRALPYEMLSAYDRSAQGRRNRLLYGDFAERAGALAQSYVNPFTAVPVGGVAEQLQAATRMPIAGIDTGSVRGLEVAGNVVRGVNELTGKPQDGVLGDLQLLAVNRLRSTLSQDKRSQLLKLGIDINTIPGLREAVERSPELAARGLPEVAQAIFRTQREYLPREILQTMLTPRFGATGARILATGDESSFMEIMEAAGKRQLGDDGADAKRYRRLAEDIAGGRPDLDAYWQMTARPDVELLKTSIDLVQDLGKAITQMSNDMVATLREELQRFFYREPAPTESPYVSSPTNPYTPNASLDIERAMNVAGRP